MRDGGHAEFWKAFKVLMLDLQGAQWIESADQAGRGHQGRNAEI